MHKQQGWPQAWEYCQAKLIQTLERASQGVNWSWSQCIKSHHAQTSSREELPSHFWNRKHRQKHLTWAKEKKNRTVAQWSKVLFSDESKFCISFGNQGPRVWRKMWRQKSMLLEVQCEVSTVSDDLGCHVICWCWSTVFSEVHSQRSYLPGNFRALHASFCWQALWRGWFHFPAGLGTCPHYQRYQKLVQWPWCYCAWLASKLAWPEPHRESMGYCQEENERHQTKQCRWPEGCYQSNLGFHYTSAVPQADCLHATPHWCSNSCKRRSNQVLSS